MWYASKLIIAKKNVLLLIYEWKLKNTFGYKLLLNSKTNLIIYVIYGTRQSMSKKKNFVGVD